MYLATRRPRGATGSTTGLLISLTAFLWLTVPSYAVEEIRNLPFEGSPSITYYCPSQETTDVTYFPECPSTSKSPFKSDLVRTLTETIYKSPIGADGILRVDVFVIGCFYSDGNPVRAGSQSWLSNDRTKTLSAATTSLPTE